MASSFQILKRRHLNKYKNRIGFFLIKLRFKGHWRDSGRAPPRVSPVQWQSQPALNDPIIFNKFDHFCSYNRLSSVPYNEASQALAMCETAIKRCT